MTTATLPQTDGLTIPELFAAMATDERADYLTIDRYLHNLWNDTDSDCADSRAEFRAAAIAEYRVLIGCQYLVAAGLVRRNWL